MARKKKKKEPEPVEEEPEPTPEPTKTPEYSKIDIILKIIQDAPTPPDPNKPKGFWQNYEQFRRDYKTFLNRLTAACQS